MPADICPECDNLELYNFSYSEGGDFPKKYPNVKFIGCRPHLKGPQYWQRMKRDFDSMDCVFNVTYGDGFADIYGKSGI